MSQKRTGWKPIPLPLKILSVIFILWSIGAVLNIPNLYESGLPLLGVFVHGIVAVLIIVLLDIIGPIIFLFALWYRKPWAVLWAFCYIGFFILNSIIAFFAVREQLGLIQILIPTIISTIFIIVIYTKRSYFK